MSEGLRTIRIGGIDWNVTEVTTDSAVVTDWVRGKQTVAFRFVCERPIVAQEVSGS